MTNKRDITLGLGGIVGGAWTFVTSIPDPTFILSVDLWWPIVSVFSGHLGPELVPGVPWETVGIAAAALFIAVSLYRLQKKRGENA
ncbi:hypothetical protein [Haloprofundus sp. MHR1]|uniref:hypothetical protein n=1 Tax=Haloprofundus sp. MHR1 TaxID=2572921 RepID=UPI0010BE2FCC|nr:hypothetical protein [Haloprofundus sp. MHR1]QCJ47247.1 hypothetical protein FCF25_09015 [Haloprofundus sp. MHR1]